MAYEILMPKLGLTMTEGTVEEWKFREGDYVKKGDALFSVSTDKLTNDVESEAEGVLLKILLPAGETAPCKAIVGYLGQEGESVPGGAKPDEGTAAPQTETAPAAKPAYERRSGEPVIASPAAKKLAREKHIELSLVEGTGPKGRITLEDVENFLKAEAEKPPVKTSPTAAKLAAELGVDTTTLGVEGRVMKADVLAAAESAGVGRVPESNELPPVRVNSLRRSIAAGRLHRRLLLRAGGVLSRCGPRSSLQRRRRGNLPESHPDGGCPVLQPFPCQQPEKNRSGRHQRGQKLRNPNGAEGQAVGAQSFDEGPS